MLIGSLVELHAWLHSYLCFSLLEKLFLSNLDTSSTPGYLSSFSTSYLNLDSFSIAMWIDRQTFWTLDSFSIASGSIELLYYLFYWIVPRQLHLPKPIMLDTYSTPLDTSICRDLLNSYIYVQCDLFLTFLDLSLDKSISSPPKHSFLSQNLQPTWFSNSPCFKSLGMLSFLLILHAFLAFRSRFWGFLKNFGVFQNCWVLVKFWDVFLFKWSLNLIHCIT